MLYLFIQKMYYYGSKYLKKKIISLCPIILASLLRESVVPAALVFVMRETNISCKQEPTALYPGHQTDIRQGTLLSDRLLHGLSKAAACQCLDLLYALVRPRISFICDFRHAFWRQKLFSRLDALNVELWVSVEYSSPFNDFCPVTYWVLSFSWRCNKNNISLSCVFFLLLTFKICFVCSVLSW